MIELGLVGTGIGRSLAPMLHETLGRLTDRPVRYTLHDLAPDRAPSLGEFFAEQARRGVVGVNVTHPFKERALDVVTTIERDARTIGAINTVRFEPTGFRGYNTDHSGFLEAYRRKFGDAGPGVVAQLGAGGFGRAAAFAVSALGADAVRLHDVDRSRAEGLAADVAAVTGVAVTVHTTGEDAVAGANGLMNATPVGMHHHPGLPVDPGALAGLHWVFDAVYTPLATDLLAAARVRGIPCLEGSELFFWQGVHAYEVFHGTPLDGATIETAARAVRAELAARAARDQAQS